MDWGDEGLQKPTGDVSQGLSVELVTKKKNVCVL